MATARLPPPPPKYALLYFAPNLVSLCHKSQTAFPGPQPDTKFRYRVQCNRTISTKRPRNCTRAREVLLSLDQDSVSLQHCRRYKAGGTQMPVRTRVEKRRSFQNPPEVPVMINRTNTMRSWRQIAAEVAQENDPRKRNELTAELLQVVEREKCLAEAQSQFIKKPPTKTRLSVDA